MLDRSMRAAGRALSVTFCRVARSPRGADEDTEKAGLSRSEFQTRWAAAHAEFGMTFDLLHYNVVC